MKRVAVVTALLLLAGCSSTPPTIGGTRAIEKLTSGAETGEILSASPAEGGMVIVSDRIVEPNLNVTFRESSTRLRTFQNGQKFVDLPRMEARNFARDRRQAHEFPQSTGTTVGVLGIDIDSKRPQLAIVDTSTGTYKLARGAIGATWKHLTVAGGLFALVQEEGSTQSIAVVDPASTAVTQIRFTHGQIAIVVVQVNGSLRILGDAWYIVNPKTRTVTKRAATVGAYYGSDVGLPKSAEALFDAGAENPERWDGSAVVLERAKNVETVVVQNGNENIFSFGPEFKDTMCLTTKGVPCNGYPGMLIVAAVPIGKGSGLVGIRTLPYNPNQGAWLLEPH
jgi:hypothetical protein